MSLRRILGLLGMICVLAASSGCSMIGLTAEYIGTTPAPYLLADSGSDSNFDGAVRLGLGKYKGELTDADYEKVEGLSLPNPYLEDLSPMEKCPNVVSLTLHSTRVKDFTPLAYLAKLVSL